MFMMMMMMINISHKLEIIRRLGIDERGSVIIASYNTGWPTSILLPNRMSN